MGSLLHQHLHQHLHLPLLLPLRPVLWVRELLPGGGETHAATCLTNIPITTKVPCPMTYVQEVGEELEMEAMVERAEEEQVTKRTFH